MNETAKDITIEKTFSFEPWPIGKYESERSKISVKGSNKGHELSARSPHYRSSFSQETTTNEMREIAKFLNQVADEIDKDPDFT